MDEKKDDSVAASKYREKNRTEINRKQRERRKNLSAKEKKAIKKYQKEYQKEYARLTKKERSVYGKKYRKNLSEEKKAIRKEYQRQYQLEYKKRNRSQNENN